jgi:hypothetical protein
MEIIEIINSFLIFNLGLQYECLRCAHNTKLLFLEFLFEQRNVKFTKHTSLTETTRSSLKIYL